MSAVARHTIETGHQIHWKAGVLKNEVKTTERKIHEALRIHRLAKRNRDNVMNEDTGMELSQLWLS